MTLRAGHLSTFYHTATLMMSDMELEQRLGFGLTWELFGTGPAIVEAFKHGQLDIAYIGLPPAIIGIAGGAPIKCIAGGHIEGTVLSGGRSVIRDAKSKSFSDALASLVGKRVGVPGKGSIHDVILADALKRHGLAGKVEVLNFKWADYITEEMVKGRLDAAVGTPALAIAIKTYAGGHIMCPASGIWPHNPSYGIVVSNNVLAKKKIELKRFLIAHEQASALLRDDPKEAAQRIARITGVVGPEFVEQTIAVSPRYCAQLTDGYIASTMRFVPVLKKLDYIDTEPSQDEIFDTSIIKIAHGADSHY